MNNPIRLIDPDGRSTEDWMKANNVTANDLINVYQAPDPQQETNTKDNNSDDNADKCCKTIGPPKHQPKPEKVKGGEDEDKTAEDIDKAGTLAGYIGIALDVTHDAVEAQNLLKLAKIAHYGGLTTVLVGTAADAYLATTINPKTGKPYLSKAMAGTNLGVAVVALYVGGAVSGPAGIAIEVGYIGAKDYMEFAHSHPDFVQDTDWLH